MGSMFNLNDCRLEKVAPAAGNARHGGGHGDCFRIEGRTTVGGAPDHSATCGSLHMSVRDRKGAPAAGAAGTGDMTLVTDATEPATTKRAHAADVDMELKARFRASMRLVASSVAVITAAHKGERGGLTATAVCSLSVEPPLILVCVNRSSRTHRLIVRGRRFCVNYLSDDHHHVARIFATGQGLPEEKFAAGSWTERRHGTPVLAGCLATMECTVRRKFDEGTHTVFIGAVDTVEMRPELTPLIYLQSDFARLANRS